MARPSFRKKKEEATGSASSFSTEKISVGDIRKTQLITTFGVGSIVDFKKDTVVIASTDDWDYPGKTEEVEKRMIFNENLSVITGADYFLSPRTTTSTNSFSNGKNVASYLFPEKLYCSKCGFIYDIHELDIHQRHKCPKCKNQLNASRFIVVCTRGHMDDFPYSWWVHTGRACPSGKQMPRIRMTNIYNRSDIDSLRLECTECGAARSMMQVFSENALSGFPCTCKHPHFKDPLASAAMGCSDKMRVRLRSASGVYFPITKAALLIPPWSKKIVQCIQKNYSILTHVSNEKIIEAVRDLIEDRNISDFEIECALGAVRKSQEQQTERTEISVLEDEYSVLSENTSHDEEGFSSYCVDVPDTYRKYFDQVTVIDRLTVTQAFTGFTRITRNEKNIVPISQYPKKWLPAVELTGEGIFIKFNSDYIFKWSQTNAPRYRRMANAMKACNFIFQCFSDVYVLLHSFAHLFIREISNVCGYSTASIREKIYSEIDAETKQIKMCGVLVYVSSTDSDSSLGGLISVADNTELLENILDSMLERAKWCSADPLCISSMKQGYKNLNYASCHDCTLLPETSCERFNVFLDRASIIGTPDNPSLGFFCE